MSNCAIKIENLKKEYKLGSIGGNTLRAELQSTWARWRKKDDPNLKIGENYKDYGKRFLALDNINLDIKKGEAVGIIGGNGAGKSTLLKILSRITAPTEGDVWINGRIASMLEVGTGFHGELTGRENIYMNGAILGMTKKEVDEKIESIIDFSECRQFIDTPVKRYSSGMYVKLAFAVASHLDAEIMIMDEVLAVGDMAFQKKCLGKMGDEAKSGKTVLYVSHNMATIRNLCTRVIVLNKGKIIFDGDVEKGIEIYLNNDNGIKTSHYDLQNEQRVNKMFGKDFHINSLTFNKDIPIYKTEDELNFKVKYNSKNDNNGTRFFIHIFNANNGNPITLTTSDIIDANKEECILSLPINNLSSGEYYFEIGALELMPNGNHITLDRIDKRILFEVIRDDSNKLPKWSNSVFGNIIFPSLKVV